jgi:hypothetical protein
MFVPLLLYDAKACRTAANTFCSDGNLIQPFCATFSSPIQTVNSPLPPSSNSGSTPNSFLINAATLAARGRYEAHTLQKRMRIFFMSLTPPKNEQTNCPTESHHTSILFFREEHTCASPFRAGRQNIRAAGQERP